MRDLASRLIEVHGQHEHQGLLVPESHLDLLDAYAGLETRRDEVSTCYQRVGALRAERDTLRLDEKQKLARVDLLTFQREEIAKAAPRPGEDVTLDGERHVLANAERLVQLSGEAYQALYERDVNLRIGFRFLNDLLKQYRHDYELALLAYNRGPGRVNQIVADGGDPSNGYENAVLRGYQPKRITKEMQAQARELGT